MFFWSHRHRERHADQALATVTGKHVIHWTVGWWCCCCWIQNRFSQWKERHISKNYSTQNATPVAANLLPDYVVGSSTAEYTDRDRQAVGDWMLRLNWGRVSSAMPEIILLQKRGREGAINQTSPTVRRYPSRSGFPCRGVAATHTHKQWQPACEFSTSKH